MTRRLKRIREAKRVLEARAKDEAAATGQPTDSAKPDPKAQYNFTDPESRIMFRQQAVPQGMTMFDYGAAMKAYLPIGESTSYEVQAFGTTMVTKMNGLVVCEANTVEVRNIQVREGTN